MIERKPEPERFKSRLVSKDGTSFTIKVKGQVHKFRYVYNKSGGWFDEFGN